MAQLRKVTPEVDVWSLGCTLSETAVWLKQGTAGLEAYRNERRDETNSISTFQDKEAFHDGEKVSLKKTYSPKRPAIDMF